MRATAFAFTTSFGRFFAAGVNFAVGAQVSRMGTLGKPVAFTAIAFAIGLLVIPFAVETRWKSATGLSYNGTAEQAAGNSGLDGSRRKSRRAQNQAPCATRFGHGSKPCTTGQARVATRGEAVASRVFMRSRIVWITALSPIEVLIMAW